MVEIKELTKYSLSGKSYTRQVQLFYNTKWIGDISLPFDGIVGDTAQGSPKRKEPEVIKTENTRTKEETFLRVLDVEISEELERIASLLYSKKINKQKANMYFSKWNFYKKSAIEFSTRLRYVWQEKSNLIWDDICDKYEVEYETTITYFELAMLTLSMMEVIPKLVFESTPGDFMSSGVLNLKAYKVTQIANEIFLVEGDKIAFKVSCPLHAFFFHEMDFAKLAQISFYEATVGTWRIEQERNE